MKIPRINSNSSNNSHNLYLFGPLQAFNDRWTFPCLFPSSFIILLLLFFVCSLWQAIQSYTGCHKLSKCCSGDALHWVLKSPIATSSASMTHIGPRAHFCMCAAPFRPRLEYSCKTTAPCRATRTCTQASSFWVVKLCWGFLFVSLFLICLLF